MKKLFLIKEPSGKWNFSLVVNGRQILESVKQGYKRQNYANRKDCEKASKNNVKFDLVVVTSRKDYNDRRKNKGL